LTSCLSWTEAVYDIFDLPRGIPVRREDIVELYEDDSRQQMERLRREAIRAGGSFSMEARIRSATGARRWMRLSASVVRDQNRSLRLFGVKQDITAERLWRDEGLDRRSYDPLTGLMRADGFEERLAKLHGQGIGGALGALLFVDVNGLVDVNDRHGRDAGDACLREVAQRLLRAFPTADLVARIGGQRFAVLIAAPLMRLTLMEMLARARHGLSRPIIWQAERFDLTVAFGVTVPRRAFPRSTRDITAQAGEALAAGRSNGQAIRIFGDDPRDGF